MWHWLAQNKQWVFSGAGLTVLAVLWWLAKRLALTARPSSPNTNNSITQAPVINVSPTFNVSQAARPVPSLSTTSSGGVPPRELPSREETAKREFEPNLVCVKTFTTHLYATDPFVFRDARDSPVQGDAALVVVIANRPVAGRGVATVYSVKAQIICRSGNQEIYSGLGAWIDHFSNAVDFPPAQSQKLIIAITNARLPGLVFGMTNPRSYRVPSRPWSAVRNVLENSPLNDMPVLKDDVLEFEVTLLDKGIVLGTLVFTYERSADGTFKLTKNDPDPPKSN